MHEEAMLRDLVRKAEEVARGAGGRRVTRVRLWAGARSHVNGPELPARWEALVVGTPLSGAEVEVESSHDLRDPNADRVMLRSLDVETSHER